MALPKYVDEYKYSSPKAEGAKFFEEDSGYRSFSKEEKDDFYDLMVPYWSNVMAKQYNIEADEEEYYKSIDNKKLVSTNHQKLVDTNLKTAAAQGKPKLSDVPPVALFALGAAMSDGASKYGRYNWRETGSTSSVFYDAIMRHLVDWYNGEDYAHDSKVNHLGHIMASCAILLDSELNGSLNDDRDKSHSESIARNKTWMKD